MCRDADVEVVFFDGRGGPPARGGGNTHRFYASLGPDVKTREVQTTIQGQSISSNFGTPRSASYNLELLLTAGIQHRLIDPEKSEGRRSSVRSWTNWPSGVMPNTRPQGPSGVHGVPLHLRDAQALWGDQHCQPADEPEEGRPVDLDDLRAIPFVGSWSQLKQNVPGFFGIGTALSELEKEGRLEEAAELYRTNPCLLRFWRTACRACANAISRSRPISRRIPASGGSGPRFGLNSELTRSLILRISGQSELMERAPAIAESIDLRESIILPLLVIQQAALQWLDGQGQPAEAVRFWRSSSSGRCLASSMRGAERGLTTRIVLWKQKSPANSAGLFLRG